MAQQPQALPRCGRSPPSRAVVPSLSCPSSLPSLFPGQEAGPEWGNDQILQHEYVSYSFLKNTTKKVSQGQWYNLFSWKKNCYRLWNTYSVVGAEYRKFVEASAQFYSLQQAAGIEAGKSSSGWLRKASGARTEAQPVSCRHWGVGKVFS